MNNVLDYEGYRFFQSSYDQDELGTILSVNHDKLGTLVTYIGYGLMMLGMLLTLFWPNTRFKSLLKKLIKLSANAKMIVLLLASLTVFNLNAQDGIVSQQEDYIAVSKEHAGKF